MSRVESASTTDAKAASLVLGLGTLVSHGFGLSLVPALLPRIEDTLASGYGVLGMAIAAGLVAYSVGGLAATLVLDLIPNRSLLNATFLLTGGALAVASAASSVFLIGLSMTIMGLTAPISWAATTHVAVRSVVRQSHSLVLGAAAGGVGLGAIVNGALLRLFSGPGQWRTAFAVAAVLSVAVTLGSVHVFRRPIDRPSTGLEGISSKGSYRQVLMAWPGRVVVIASAVAGVSAYTFMTYLTTTAIEEMGASAAAAAAILWAMGGIGVFASLALGRLGDRSSPTLAVASIYVACALGLGVVTVFWSYPGLLVASVGVALLNYPVWGLVAAIATRRFDAPLALRAVSAGLVVAAGLSAIANVIAGLWIDSVGSMQLPIAVLALMSGIVAVWLLRNYRVHVAD